MNANISIKPFSEIMAQYAARAEEANAADKAYCWCHDVWSYGAEIEKDYAELVALAAKAAALQTKITAARGEYKVFLQQRQDEVLYALHATAGNPGPNNCGIQWFN
jgi:hypothetical protein